MFVEGLEGKLLKKSFTGFHLEVLLLKKFLSPLFGLGNLFTSHERSKLFHRNLFGAFRVFRSVGLGACCVSLGACLQHTLTTRSLHACQSNLRTHATSPFSETFNQLTLSPKLFLDLACAQFLGDDFSSLLTKLDGKGGSLVWLLMSKFAVLVVSFTPTGKVHSFS